MPANCPLILGDLVNESELFRRVLCHSDHESCSTILVSFGSDALKPFAADTSTDQLVVDGRVVNRNESVGFEVFSWKKISTMNLCLVETVSLDGERRM